MHAELSDNLLTGNSMIDSQHKELIDKINELVNSFEHGKEKTEAIRTLDYLADYTDFHFSHQVRL